MSKMWKGPCDALKATYADPLAARFHRRASEQQISYTLSADGRAAQVARIEQRRSGWHTVSIGVASGDDAMNTIVNVALEFTAHDHELFALIAEHIAHRTDDVIATLRDLNKRLPIVLEDLDRELTSLAFRYE